MRTRCRKMSTKIFKQVKIKIKIVNKNTKNIQTGDYIYLLNTTYTI